MIKKLEITPTFYIFCLIEVLRGHFFIITFTIISVLLHELSHCVVANMRGYTINKIKLMPYGAVLSGEENIPPKDAFFIAISGIFANILLILVALSLSWLVPQIYPLMHKLLLINVGLILFNILPAYPLDGARVIISLSKHPLRTIKILRRIGVFISFVMFGLAILSVFFAFNPSLGLIGILLLIGATGGGEQERYIHIASMIPMVKNTSNPIAHKKLYVSSNVTLLKLLRQIKQNYIIEFVVIDENNLPIANLTEKDIEILCLSNPLQTLLKNANNFDIKSLTKA